MTSCFLWALGSSFAAIVKISAMLGGLLVFFASTRGFLNVTASCVLYWVEVKVIHSVGMRDLPLQAYELSLWYSYPVPYRDQDVFVFFYLLNSCGIRVHELPHGIVTESSIMYAPVQLGVTLHYPTSCFIPKNTSLLLSQKISLSVHYGNVAKNSERSYNRVTLK